MTDENEETRPRKGAVALDVTARKGMLETSDTGAMQPKDLGEAMEFARIIAGTKMVPSDYQNKPGDVLVAMQMGAEVGLAPMQALQNIAVINGRPALWGDAMLAVVRASPSFESIQEMDLADITEAGAATCVLKRKGEPEHTSTFTIDDAKRAGLWGKGGPWKQYPSRMLQLRARSFACRDKFPDALRGIQSAEEARDIPADVKAVATVQSSAPSSIADRIKSRRAEKVEVEVESAPVDHDNDPAPAPDVVEPETNNGELSAEEERRMMEETEGVAGQ